MTYSDPTTTEELEESGMELYAEHTGRPITVDGFDYATTAPDRMRRKSSVVDHYSRLAEEAKSEGDAA